MKFWPTWQLEYRKFSTQSGSRARYRQLALNTSVPNNAKVGKAVLKQITKFSETPLQRLNHYDRRRPLQQYSSSICFEPKFNSKIIPISFRSVPARHKIVSVCPMLLLFSRVHRSLSLVSLSLSPSAQKALFLLCPVPILAEVIWLAGFVCYLDNFTPSLSTDIYANRLCSWVCVQLALFTVPDHHHHRRSTSKH